MTFCSAVRLSFAVFLSILYCLNAADAYNLPDTGQTQCFSTKGKIKIIPCPAPGDPAAQDGSYSIAPPSYTVNRDGTVVDKQTTLMWQQLDDGKLKTWAEADNYCRTLALGGYRDWRLPTIRELIGIVNYGQASPAIDRTAFPNTKGAHYWSGTTIPCFDAEPLSVNFASGVNNRLASTLPAYARCVRNGPLPFAYFRENGNGTVTDLSTGLMWLQNEKSPLTWVDALGYCENLSFGGFSDWRVPNIKEYESLTRGTEGPSVMSDYFKSSSGFPNWSSTSYLAVTDYTSKWTLDTEGMVTVSSTKERNTSKYGVRCVRGKHQTPLDEQEISVSPHEVELWQTNSSRSTQREIVITNTGKGFLSVAPVAPLSPPFVLIADTCAGKSISSLMSCSITVGFDPSAEGNFTGDLVVSSNDRDSPAVNVVLKGSSIGAYYLPDTGQTTCYDKYGTRIYCPQPGSPLAQDGSYRMNPPSHVSFPDGTVRDKNTSLLWQKVDDGVPRTWGDALSYCEDLELAGFADWRLPTLQELIGIADYGRAYPSIDVQTFPATQQHTYWSSSASNVYKDHAYGVSFTDGSMGKSAKTQLNYVRCVKGPQVPIHTLVNNGDGTTTDLLTGLMWEQGDSTDANWEAALARCEGLSLGGHSDWRLPNIKELISILDIRYKPAIRYSYFPAVNCGYWSNNWTSTSYLALQGDAPYHVPDAAYFVDFFNSSCGGLFEHKFYSNRNARCVRGGTTKPPTSITGRVTDAADGTPLGEVHIVLTDRAFTYTLLTDSDGYYSRTDLFDGPYTASFEKAGYAKQIINGALLDGQTLTLNVQLSPLSPPSLTIAHPPDGAVFTASPIEVRGSVSGAATVTVNGLPATVNNGFFSATVSLQRGQNTLFVTAVDSLGRSVSKSITVIFLTQGVLSGSVTAAHTRVPVESARVAVRDSLDTLKTTLTDVDGRFTIDGIEAGPVTISVSKDGFSQATLTEIIEAGTTKIVPLVLIKIFSAITLGDFGSVTVMEVTGNYDALTPEGSLNILARQEIAREFLRLHPDEYDFLVVFTNFSMTMPDPLAKGFYLDVKNDTRGIGKALIDNTAAFGSAGRLQGMIDMGNVVTSITDPRHPLFDDTVNTLMHEMMHRWGSFVKYKDGQGDIRSDLLGKDGSHWNFLLDTGASLHYGNAWTDNGDGTFTSIGGGKYCSPLDLYLMGFYDGADVPPMLLIENVSIDPARRPEPGARISGSPRFVTIDDIIAAEGARVPDVSSSQKVFKAAFILITTPGSFSGEELQGIENLRSAWAGKFSALTGGRGRVADVAPSLSVMFTYPSDGQIVSGTVPVKGTFLNSTGSDTGITVNGVPAVVYGNQFILNHVSLPEGASTIIATATDSSGHTASASVNVTARPASNFIQLLANAEAGIAPFDLTMNIDSTFRFDDLEMSITGPSRPVLLSDDENDYRFRIDVEGMYSFTARASSPEGVIHEDTIFVTVINSQQMDNMLRRKWEGMKEALLLRDFETAVSFLSAETKSHYYDLYSALDEHMPQIARDMQGIEPVYINGTTAKYRIPKEENHGGEIVTITHYIYFVVDHDGLWKIDWY